MEKENKAKISLPGCVVVAVVSLFISVLALSIVALWEVMLLKQQVQNQANTLRELQTKQGDEARWKSTASLERREIQQLKQTLQDLISKAQYTQWRGRVARAANRPCRCRRGPKGERGPKGQKGQRGRRGSRGRLGPRGAKGERGLSQGIPTRRRKGEDGETDPQPRSPLFAESAHIEGYGGEINPLTGIKKFHRLTNWRPGHVSGRMRFVDHGILVIGVSGYYYVYSQMFYYSGHSYYMAHYLYINENPRLRSLSSVPGLKRKYNTNYHGGVFYLTAGDRITIRVPFNKTLFMNSETSYFGAFLIFPTETTPRPAAGMHTSSPAPTIQQRED